MQLQKENLGKVAITIEEGYWDINKDYDKLTIVEKEGTFGTFISRKPVPAGVTLTDRKYWIPFSSLKEEILLDYNAFIAKYNNIIEEINNTIEDHTSTINEHTETINEHTSTIDEHSNSIEEILKSKQQWENKVLYINVTYKELVEKRNAKLLIPGVNYRIIDYDTIAEGSDNQGAVWKSAMHPFDIIVQSIDESTLSHHAKAAKSKRDTTNYFDANDLAGWQLWYDLDNNKKYYWAREDAKGIIYRMIDSNNNDLCYDFKNIMFKRYFCKFCYIEPQNIYVKHAYFFDDSVLDYDYIGNYYTTKDVSGNKDNIAVVETFGEKYVYTFNKSGKDGSNEYISKIVYNNKITHAIYNTYWSLPNIVFLSGYIDQTSNDGINEYNSNSLSVYNNIIYNSSNCTFRYRTLNNIIYNSKNIISNHELNKTNIRNSDDIFIHDVDNTTINKVQNSIINYSKYCSLQNSNIVCYGIESTEIKNSNIIFYFTDYNKIYDGTRELYNSIMNNYNGDMIVHDNNEPYEYCIKNKCINKNTIMDI